jgi:hypothetical protein
MAASVMRERHQRMRRLYRPRPGSGRGTDRPPRASSIILAMVITMLGLLLGASALQLLIETLFSYLAAS